MFQIIWPHCASGTRSCANRWTIPFPTLSRLPFHPRGLGSQPVMAWTSSLLYRSFQEPEGRGKKQIFCLKKQKKEKKNGSGGPCPDRRAHQFQLAALLPAGEIVPASSPGLLMPALPGTHSQAQLWAGDLHFQLGSEPWNIQCQWLSLSYFFIFGVATQLICK